MREKYYWMAENKRLKAQVDRLKVASAELAAAAATIKPNDLLTKDFAALKMRLCLVFKKIIFYSKRASLDTCMEY
jgi:hypothetical protein